MSSSRTILQLRFIVAIVLMAALLCAQWTGLKHRIEHSPFASLGAKGLDGGDPKGSHSCVAFDAAAVADAIALPPFAAPALTGASVLAFWAAFSS